MDIVIATFVPFLTNCIMLLPSEPLEGPEGAGGDEEGLIAHLSTPRQSQAKSRTLFDFVYWLEGWGLTQGGILI